MNAESTASEAKYSDFMKVYDLPVWTRRVSKLKIFKCLPICPVHEKNKDRL